MPQNNKPGRRLLRQLYGSWYRVRHNISIFARWCLFAVIIGVVVGAVGAAFEHALEWATETRQEQSWTLYFLPLVGVFIAFWYSKMDMPLERGTNFILTSVRQDHPVRLRLAPSIFITSVLTHLCGGSAGREGAALQLGGAISGNIGHLMHLDDKDSRTITMCGMAACFSALFGTPLAASVFAMEVISVGVMYYAALVPCVVASLTALQVAQGFGLHQSPGYEIGRVLGLGPVSMVQTAALGLLCALVSILFCKVLHTAPKLYAKYFPNPLLRAAAGGALVLALTLLVGSQDYNGAGDGVIRRMLAGETIPEAFLMKILFTALTLGAGFRGGEIVPVLFTGAAFGTTVGPLLGLPHGFGGALGMAAVFCGATNCPMTALMLAFELFGGESLTLYAVCCGVSYMLSGYYGLYSEQKIVYSKFRTEWIDKKAR